MNDRSKNIVTFCLTILFIVIMGTSCVPFEIVSPETPTTTPVNNQTPTTILNTVELINPTDDPTSTPDVQQQPPDYRIEKPDFAYQFFDLPISHIDKPLITFWRDYSDKEEPGGYVEYLTLEGEQGRLLEITFPPETAKQYWLGVEKYSSGRRGKINDSHSLLVQLQDERGRRYAYIIDIQNQSILGISFDLGDGLECEHSFLGEEYLVWACSRPGIEYLDGLFSDYLLFYFFIPRDNPENIIFLGEKEGYFPRFTLSWHNGRFWFKDSRSHLCFINIEDRKINCGEEPDDFYFGDYISPDNKWMEVHPRFEHHPQVVGLLPLHCFENQNISCEPDIVVSIAKIMETWWSNCRGIDYGVWTPDSQSLLWLTHHWSGAAGEETCGLELDMQELWKYDLGTESLSKIDEFKVEEFETDSGIVYPFYFSFSKNPTIWSDDGNFAVLLYGPPGPQYSSYYLISIDDGQMTYLGELPGEHLGFIQLQ